jgi:hypothetical protein
MRARARIMIWPISNGVGSDCLGSTPSFCTCLLSDIAPYDSGCSPPPSGPVSPLDDIVDRESKCIVMDVVESLSPMNHHARSSGKSFLVSSCSRCFEVWMNDTTTRVGYNPYLAWVAAPCRRGLSGIFRQTGKERKTMLNCKLSNGSVVRQTGLDSRGRVAPLGGLATRLRRGAGESGPSFEHA